ncbi:MAG: flagellar biosynthesis anti-sigma factor FlgM [Candidatus Aminicenantes bacterium]|nr:flagellar biosynthesis anti-sigma factor FlgM [Candidatus Aminicenantes bacterium]NIM77199.1 flagellar biosynthesis anti-sigma factor FlgM [Candidatus Aminicenantes bacterium]NIN16493.1 flagellar biosynthesis anti-sigma factor FlgM [Candidatus Aminicenantes bacterium]NIN40353.1 flagellar biosynthesis anti-sigma factor FlgM [Candidatus Aminicenantes bacterium]NIN83173.1 flagellar biosynthesis anti-sigma factor FlgM [Candidatus Aminicenantes bacterium]
MGIDIDANGTEKRNSEFIQKALKRIKKNEEMQGAAMASPDVRTEKVEQIKMQINSGTYKISTEEIAEQLIEEAMEN